MSDAIAEMIAGALLELQSQDPCSTTTTPPNDTHVVLHSSSSATEISSTEDSTQAVAVGEK